jgi:hypothetical protein
VQSDWNRKSWRHFLLSSSFFYYTCAVERKAAYPVPKEETGDEGGEHQDGSAHSSIQSENYHVFSCAVKVLENQRRPTRITSFPTRNVRKMITESSCCRIANCADFEDR